VGSPQVASSHTQPSLTLTYAALLDRARRYSYTADARLRCQRRSVLVVTILLSKQAFMNYFLLVSGAFLIAAISWPVLPEPTPPLDRPVPVSTRSPDVQLMRIEGQAGEHVVHARGGLPPAVTELEQLSARSEAHRFRS